MNVRSYQSERETISMDGEIKSLQSIFEQVKDKHGSNARHKLSDILMSGFAIFSLKYPSLLDFDKQNQVENLNLTQIYGIEKVCSDT